MIGGLSLRSGAELLPLVHGRLVIGGLSLIRTSASKHAEGHVVGRQRREKLKILLKLHANEDVIGGGTDIGYLGSVKGFIDDLVKVIPIINSEVFTFSSTVVHL